MKTVKDLVITLRMVGIDAKYNNSSKQIYIRDIQAWINPTEDAVRHIIRVLKPHHAW